MGADKKGKAPVDKGIDGCGDSKGRWFNYERIGLYWVTRRRHERINFCDVHFFGSLGELGNQRGEQDPEGHNGSYSGPDQKIVPTRDRWRTHDDRDVYGRCVEYKDPDDEKKPNARPPWERICAPRGVDRGGDAHIIFNSKRGGTFECWLFGPLHLGGPDPQNDGFKAYGSLVVELEDFGLHPWQSARGSWPKGGIKSPTDDTPWDAPGKGRVGVFRPCTLWGSHYSSDKRETDAGKLALLTLSDQFFPAHLPRSVERVEWKIEATATKLTLCQIYDQHG
jgi:hypothetical protein